MAISLSVHKLSIPKTLTFKEKTKLLSEINKLQQFEHDQSKFDKHLNSVRTFFLFYFSAKLIVIEISNNIFQGYQFDKKCRCIPID